MEHPGAQGGSWTILTGHGHVLAEIARNPYARLREISPVVGLTERTVQAIVTDLEAAGYLTRTRTGRRTCYQVNRDRPFRHYAQKGLRVGPFLDLLAEADLPAPAAPARAVMTAPVTGALPPARQLPQAAPAPPGAPTPGRHCAGDQPLAFSRAKAACDHAQRLIKEAQELVTQAQAVARARADDRRAWWHGQPSRGRRKMLHRSEYLRLVARLETMPVIEQAKGILMAQQGCTGTEAFDLLRRASQRSNVPVRELAAQIVANTVDACRPASKAG